jgi:hypothetical protein
MGFRSRWTEEQFEEWFHARFDRWINERFDTELEPRLQARDTTAGRQFQDRFDALFKIRFEVAFQDQLKTWQDDGMPGVDTWAENFFDNLFTVYANTWGDSVNFQQRFDERFKEKFEERLESEVRARVANELADRIDKRIEQWLVSVRQQLLGAAEAPADQPSVPPVEGERSADAPTDEPAPTATAAQLADYLAKGPLGVNQIRKLLRGQEIPGQRPSKYLLGEAAATLLARRGRRSRAPRPSPDAGEDRHDGTADL